MLSDVVNDAEQTLAADPYFGNITLVTEDKGDIENQIQIALSKLGICVILLTPRATDSKPNIGKPYFDNILFIAQVTENVTLNRAHSGTGKKALDVCEHVVAVLKGHKPPNVSECLTCQKPTIQLQPNLSPLTYHVIFGTQGGIDYPIPVVADPVVVVTGSGSPKTVTITCATPRALIVYSVVNNGVPNPYPNPRNANSGDAFWYDAPISVATGKKLVCRAWLPGYIATKLVKQSI